MTTDTVLLKRRLFVTRAIFLIVGLGMAVWAPLVPVVKANMDLSEAALGVLILSLGFGVLLTMPFAGALAAKLGIRRAIIWPLLIGFGIFPVMLITESPLVAGLCLAVFGAGISISDVAMNMQAVIVEEDSGRPHMSFFHGMWSVGVLFGSLAVTGLLTLGMAPVGAAIVVLGAGAVAALILRGGLIAKSPEDEEKPLFVLPRGRIIFVGVLCALAILPEFSVFDWSAVFLTDQLGLPVASAGLGIAAFSVGMVGMRFGGDRARAAFGDAKVLLFGGLLGAAGLVLVAVSTSLWMALAAYLLAGLGIANIVPIMFSIAGRSKDMPAHLALPAVVMVAQVGALGGPGFIGFIAEATSLRVAFVVLAVGVLVVSASFRIGRDEP